MKPRLWTAGQVRTLRKLYANTPSARIARRLRLDIGQVRSKAALLGLKKSARFLAGPHSGRRRKGCIPTFGKAWTKRDVRLLIKRYPDTRNAAIAAELERKVPQVYAKARALGLQKRVKRARLSTRQERAIARAFTGTPENMESLAKKYELKNARQIRTIVRRVDGRKARRSRRRFTAAEDAMIRAWYPTTLTRELAKKLKRKTFSVHVRARVLGISKSPEYMHRQHQEEGRRLREVGKAHRFKKGLIPPNKGKRMPGYGPGRMRETQFKKGESRNRMPLLSERIIDGYLYIKVAEVPKVPYTVNWKPVHVLNWERANGRPLTRDECLRFRDGNRMNVEVSNLELITRRENILRNSIHKQDYPPALKEVILLQGRLTRAIKRREGREKQDRRSA